MAFKALADMFFGNKIGFKKERKKTITAKTQYTLLLLFLFFVLFFGPPNFKKRGNSLEHFLTTQMPQPTHFKLFKNIGYIAQFHY